MRQFSLVGLLFVVLGLPGCQSVLLTGNIELEISVVDSQGHPVPYPTIWRMYATPDAPELSLADMERLLRRYASQQEIAGHSISAVLVGHGDEKGQFTHLIRPPNFKGMDALPVFVGIIKRGFRPLAYAKTMPGRTSHKIELTLDADPEPFDARLLEIDEIRGKTDRPPANLPPDQQAAYVDAQHERLRALAETFEREGKNDLAAIAFFSLAHLRSIDRIVGPDGKPIIVGYTRGYDNGQPVRKASLQRAFALGAREPSLPALRCRALARPFYDQNGTYWADRGPAMTALRKALINDLETCVRDGGERILPVEFWLLSHLYSAVGEQRKACEAMQRRFLFEPRDVEASQWPEVFANADRFSKLMNGGVPPEPDFKCEAPRH